MLIFVPTLKPITMARQTKIARIQKFIGENKPTRRELTTFILTGSKKPLPKDVYSNNRGFYSTNITQWRYYGYVTVNPKTKRYELTKLGRSTTHFYKMPLEMKIEQLKRSNAYLINENREMLKMRRIIRNLQNTLNEL